MSWQVTATTSSFMLAQSKVVSRLGLYLSQPKRCDTAATTADTSSWSKLVVRPAKENANKSCVDLDLAKEL